MNFASDLDYVRGIHSIRVGTAIDFNSFRSDESDNYLGTYTFESLEAFDAGRPRSYTRRIGEPNVRYVNLQGAFYVQDDIRIRRNLSMTPGVRVETQNHIKGVVAGPRFGATWAPFKNGKTTLRASWGVFYDWLATNTYEQTLRIDGFQQREINIANPLYPDTPLDIAGVTPADRYLLDPALKHPQNSRVSAGVDYAFSPRYRVNATYRYIRGDGLLRGLNLNAPVDGLRPSPQFGNVIQVVGDGQIATARVELRRPDELSAGAGTEQPGAGISGGSISSATTRWPEREQRRRRRSACLRPGISISSGATPPSHARHRFNGGFLTQAFRDLAMQVNVNGNLGTTYSIQTGVDDNGDLIFNDRPAGIARNTLVTPETWTLNMFTGYSFTFGPSIQLPPGIQFGPAPAAR